MTVKAPNLLGRAFFNIYPFEFLWVLYGVVQIPVDRVHVERGQFSAVCGHVNAT